MPEELERKLQREATAKFPDDPERQRRYVYGTLRKTGWTPKKSDDWRPPDYTPPRRRGPGFARKFTNEELRAKIRPERKKPARFKD